jgi:hypothetical protein
MAAAERRSEASRVSVTAAHKALRKAWARTVAMGGVRCARADDCPYPGGLIQPGQAWDLDHTDDRSGYLGPSHRSCNRRAAAQKTNALRAAGRTAAVRSGGRRVWSRHWLDHGPEVDCRECREAGR